MSTSYTPARIQGRKPKGARIDFETIRSVSQRNALAICRRVIPGGKVIGAEYVVCNPKRTDKRPGSFKVNISNGKWSDFATGERGGDLIALVAWRYDITQAEAARRLASLLLLQAEVIR
jgi:hypothetical protein